MILSINLLKIEKMKKVFLSMSIMLMGVFFVACTGSAPKAGEAAAEAATEVATEAADAVSIGDLKALVEKATKDGANWTEAEWKVAFKTVMKAAKPMFLEIKEMQTKAEKATDEEKLKIAGEMVDKMKGYQEVSDQIEAFGKAAEATEIGKKLSDDKGFQKEIEKDLGLEEGFFDSI